VADYVTHMADLFGRGCETQAMDDLEWSSPVERFAGRGGRLAAFSS
jgi:hypothetical protein